MPEIAKAGWNELRASVHAWQLDPNGFSAAELREQTFGWLCAKERRRWKAFPTEALRHQYLAAHALCRATLSRYAGIEPWRWRFGAGAHGKPKIVSPAKFASLRFNLTHTGGLAVCLVARARAVGVDAELTSRPIDAERLARHFLSSRERARLEMVKGSRRTARFYEQWVLKEAYFKATGAGITGAPERLTIEIDRHGHPKATGRWQLSLHRPTRTHVAAIAVRKRNPADNLAVRWFKVGKLT